MKNDTENSLLEARVRVDKLPSGGRILKINATPEQLMEVKKIAGVSNIHRLSAVLQVNPVKGGVQVTGRLEADIVQPCVVTLDPVPQKVSEPLSRVFSSAPDIHAEAGAGSENFIDLESDDLPDHFDGIELDLSDYILEVLGLAIELYPRASGAELSTEQKGDNLGNLSPFSVLKSLKDSE